jgi:hypothetical protein
MQPPPQVVLFMEGVTELTVVPIIFKEIFATKLNVFGIELVGLHGPTSLQRRNVFKRREGDAGTRRQGVSGFFLRWLLCRESPLNQFQMTSNKICLRRAS